MSGCSPQPDQELHGRSTRQPHTSPNDNPHRVLNTVSIRGAKRCVMAESKELTSSSSANMSSLEASSRSSTRVCIGSHQNVLSIPLVEQYEESTRENAWNLTEVIDVLWGALPFSLSILPLSLLIG